MANIDLKPVPRLLLVEGANDLHVVKHIADASQLTVNFETRDSNGYRHLLGQLKTEPLVTEREVLGIVVDADDYPERRWDAVLGQLSRHGFDVPPVPDKNGTIIAGSDTHPSIGIWMMPNNSSPGELEDFVADMIPNDDPIWPRSEAYIDNIPREHRKFKGKIVRAKVLSWIATREDPGFMGQAIARGDLNTNAPLCQAFIAWLNRLFTDSDPMPVAPSP